MAGHLPDTYHLLLGCHPERTIKFSERAEIVTLPPSGTPPTDTPPSDRPPIYKGETRVLSSIRQPLVRTSWDQRLADISANTLLMHHLATTGKTVEEMLWDGRIHPNTLRTLIASVTLSIFYIQCPAPIILDMLGSVSVYGTY